MGYKYIGDSMLGVSLNVNTPKPLDIRTVVNTSEDLYTLDPKTAYEGMCVANIQNGNLYMLIDKSHIADKTGWKASYESIQIITCTQDEYKKWLSNTTDGFLPVDPDEDYLHENTYYYIYEDSLNEEQQNQEYLTAAWGKQIEEQLKNKALNSTVQNLQGQVQSISTSLSTNYSTNEQYQAWINSNFYSKGQVDSLISELKTRIETLEAQQNPSV